MHINLSEIWVSWRTNRKIRNIFFIHPFSKRTLSARHCRYYQHRKIKTHLLLRSTQVGDRDKRITEQWQGDKDRVETSPRCCGTQRLGPEPGSVGEWSCLSSFSLTWAQTGRVHRRQKLQGWEASFLSKGAAHTVHPTVKVWKNHRWFTIAREGIRVPSVWRASLSWVSLRKA